jgi:hypothetical protein
MRRRAVQLNYRHGYFVAIEGGNKNGRLSAACEREVEERRQNENRELDSMFAPKPPVSGPRRLTLLPINDAAFESLSAEDKKWWDQQQQRFFSDSEGLATKPTFGLLVFETINFMDGRRSTADIADLLAAEYLLDIDQAWVDRLVGILAVQKLVPK